VQPVGMLLPAGFHPIGQQGDYTVLVRSDSVLAKDRSQRLQIDPGSPLFLVRRDILFDYATASNGAPIHDIVDALGRRGIDLRRFVNHRNPGPR